MLHEDENTAIIGLYGVVFDGEDLTGEYFTSETKFILPKGGRIPVHIDHTMESYVDFEGKTYKIAAIEDEVGEVIEVTPDNIGLYMKLQFQKSNDYWEVVEGFYNSGRMGGSTGSDHRAKKGLNGWIKTWAINEETLTLTPAEPRTIEHVTRIKAYERLLREQGYTEELIEGLVKQASDLGTFDNKQNSTEMIVSELEKDIAGTKSINETTDAESAEEEPEVTPVTAIQSDTSAEFTPEAELSAIEAAPADEVSEMTQENEAAPVAVEQEAKSFDIAGAFKSLNEKLDATSERLEALENEPQADIVVNAKSASVLQLPKGDSEANLVKAWATGNAGQDLELKASNATDMNIGTAADGGNLTQEGFYNQIIAKMQESDLVSSLPVMRLPGTETTVDIPTMGGDYEEFVTTAEAATFDLDAPVVGQQQSTLVWKTKYTDISMQLLQSAAISGGVESLLSAYFGGALAATRNSMLVSEVATNGTNFKTFAGAAAIAFGELEDMLGNGVLGRYLANDNAAAWVMQNSTLWNIRSIVGSDRQYWMDHNSNELLGYPVYRTQKAPAMATGLKSVLFGNWNYLAFREAPSLTLQRDPYTVGVKGQVRITAHFAAAFNVTQAEALGYATQA